MCAQTHQNLAQKFLCYAHFRRFSSHILKFQIFIEQSIFVVQKRVVYKKASNVDGKCHEIQIKQFA